MGYMNMSKDKKFEPKDSNEQHPKTNRIVERAEDRDYQKEEPRLKDPALKRKFSEQPPTRHNSKT